MFSPIDQTSELPKVGINNERRTIDFKGATTDDRYEIAKDVASFANAEGGTILIGAKGSGEYLASYAPLSTSDASKLQRSYEEAIRDRCSPVPLFDVVGVPVEGGFVVAVNVWPFPGQLVGVEIKKGEAKCGKQRVEPEGLYFFPLRVGTHTAAVSPEQMPMFMDPRVRRIAICLQGAIGRKVILSCPTPRSDGSKSVSGSIWLEAARLDSVDLLGNAITVAVQYEGKELAVSVPFDLIDAAWKEDLHWRILVRGRIRPMQWRADLGIPELERIQLFFDAI